MQKTKPTTLIAVGVGVLAIGGLVLFGLSGNDDKAKAEAKALAAQAEKVSPGAADVSSKEAREHLARTQRALEAAAATEAAEKANAPAAAEPAAAPAEEPKAAESPAPTAAAPKTAAAAPAAKPAAAKPAAAKPKKGSLDFGADIASALK